MKLESATKSDIALSLLIPGWGILIGLIALVKQEFRRGVAMIGISVLMAIAIIAARM